MSAALDGKLLHDQEIVAIVTVDIKPLPPNGNLDYLFIPGKYLMCLIDFSTVYYYIYFSGLGFQLMMSVNRIYLAVFVQSLSSLRRELSMVVSSFTGIMTSSSFKNVFNGP